MKKFLINTLLVVVSMSITLAAIEAYLAYDNWHPNPNDFRNEVILNGNKYKFIDTLDAINKTDTAVLIVGDSFTAGESCADKKTYPSIFTSTAKKKGVDLHAVNMGIASSAPLSYSNRIVDYFAEKGATSGVIVTLYANDIELDCDACAHIDKIINLGNFSDTEKAELKKQCQSCLQDSGKSQMVAGEVSTFRKFHWWLSHKFLSYSILRQGAAKLAYQTGMLEVNWGRMAFRQRWSDVNNLYFKYVTASLIRIKNAADRYGVPMMVVFYPDVASNLTETNEYIPIYTNASKYLSDTLGVPVYSGFEAFLGNPMADESMPFSLVDTHPSCKAHAIYGEWVFNTWMQSIKSK